MVFNWFRRQFGTNEEAGASSEVEQETSEPEVEVEAAATDSTTEDSAVAEDYLSFAKAAYKNIQKRQLESSSETASVAETTEEIAAPSSDLEVEATPVEVAAEIPVETTTDIPAEAEATTAEVQPEVEATTAEVQPEAEETTAEVQPEVEPTTTEAEPEVEPTTTDIPAEVEATTTDIPAEATVEEANVTETDAEISETPAAPVPIWARNADRQARLERLKATAIEIPEPASEQQPAAVIEDVAGIAFDESFVWSTEVLAAQGRKAQDISIEEISWLKRLRQGLDKTRRSLINQLKAIVGQGPLNQDAVDEIEALLLQADVGVEATDYIIDTLQAKLREEVLPPEQAIAYLKQILRDLLDRPCQESYSANFIPEKDVLNIWMMTGVNGAGKTTTIGKLAHLASKSGYSCLIGAADTFRAAAVEQVKVWGERSGTEIIANTGKNTDPAAVVFDAIAAAQSRNIELLLVDTAGRLQNKKNLMDELAKIRRIVDKKAPNAKIESLLVLDATLGQNGLRQAEVFAKAAKLSGVVLTKLDGTAKGGVALAVVKELGLPIRFIGAGEGVEDLRPFSSYEFVEALLNG
ncbi:MAG: signal recognition particle-docking protein FtsY [Coleofasciculaceae cyanobacterium]